MLDNILAVEGYPKYLDLPDVVIYALLGFGIVFLGICFLIGVVQLVNYVMKNLSGKQSVEPKQAKAETNNTNVAIIQENSEEIPEEVVAVITAALMAYYEQNNPKCEFNVRRIKKN